MASFEKVVTSEALKHFKEKADAAYVAQELKTGSATAKKVLSDNNLTDKLLAKINASGTSSFSGKYADLTGKPTINGKEVTGALTASGLGLATPTDVQNVSDEVNAALASYLTKTEAEKTYITPSAVDDKISMATSGVVYESGLDMKLGEYATQVYVEQQLASYYDSTTVDDKISAATSGTATQTWVKNQGYDTSSSVNSKISTAKTDMQSAIDAALTSAITPKGSCEFAKLPTPLKANLGNMWNVTDAFTTTSAFVEGAGKSYPAGSNVVCVLSGSAYKWDVQGGFVDLSPYAKAADFTLATTDDIDAMFA